MTIKYIGKTPDDEGYYLVRVDGKHLEVALFGEGLGWLQIGNDYDAWQYTTAEHQIEVIKRLDLEELARA